MKAIKTRAIEQQYIAKNKSADMEIAEIKNRAAKQVEEKRVLLKQKIVGLRKKAEKANNKLAAKLAAMRTEIASKMQNSYKVGTADHCTLIGKSDHYQQDYCVANFSDDFGKFNDCRDPEEYCNTCCDFEFGEMHIEERNKCKTDKCTTANVEAAQKGRWVWQEPVK